MRQSAGAPTVLIVIMVLVRLNGTAEAPLNLASRASG